MANVACTGRRTPGLEVSRPRHSTGTGYLALVLDGPHAEYDKLLQQAAYSDPHFDPYADEQLGTAENRETSKSLYLRGPGLAWLRAWQSGHIGDYIAWLTVGVAILGALFAFTLR